MSTEPAFAARLIEWQASHGRHTLPWQNTRDPYRVWLSEIMLQQTQVAAVLPYYARFLERFPGVRDLAAASLDDVLALWSGLGYYSRARNLHRCAQQVVTLHGGDFPASAQALAALPGIGRSTAAAIAAFCFDERVAILDGNVKRVLTRFLGFAGDLASTASERELWAHATRLLPEHGVAPYTQALMDLGATVCLSRSPMCLLCPVASDCVARREGHPRQYPVKTRKLKRSRREVVWLWAEWRECCWLVQRPDSGVWAGLWGFPEFSTQAELELSIRGWPGAQQALAGLDHAMTHIDWKVFPVRHRLPEDLSNEQQAQLSEALPPGRWFTKEEALAAGLSAPVRKLLLTAPDLS